MREHFHPLTEFGRVGDIVERTLDKVFNETLPNKTTGFAELVPNCDLLDKEDHFLLKAEVPGVKKEDLDISVSDDSVTIKGEVKEEKEEKGKRFYRSERMYGSFARTIPLPSEIKSGEVEAALKDGILELRLPKKEIKETKKVKINVK